MKSLDKYIKEDRGWGSSAPMGTRKIEWRKVAKEIADKQKIEKFLKANGLPANDFEFEPSGSNTARNGLTIDFQIIFKWDLEDLEKWAKSHNCKVTDGYEYWATEGAVQKLDFSAFTNKPSYAVIRKWKSDDEVDIILHWKNDNLEDIIDRVSPRRDPQLPVFGVPGGENDGVGRKILEGDVVAVMPRTGNASNRVYRLARVIGKSNKRWNVLTADGNETLIDGEFMIIVQRGNVVVY